MMYGATVLILQCLSVYVIYLLANPLENMLLSIKETSPTFSITTTPMGVTWAKHKNITL
jgi:hypothetical protein